jgi:2-polyprenyl-3-methyl-5-hydroxy-6-metoxy-1,4-benzoquinol methylase
MSPSTPVSYDATTTEKFYDAFGEGEWRRLEQGIVNQVQILTHTAMLEKYVKRGDAVLEAGAGPGRFSLELARLGANILIGDLSPVQLELNKRQMEAAGLVAHVAGWKKIDIVDLSELASGTFDVVVCYGGALGCVLDKAPVAARELLRVLKPGGRLLVSVTSRWGFLRVCMPAALELIQNPELLQAVNQSVVTGDDLGLGRSLPLASHLFSWKELSELFDQAGGRVVDGCAANYLSVMWPQLDEKALANPAVREAFLRWELAACRAPGALDGGTHMIAAIERR